jgi:hypothetical protein
VASESESLAPVVRTHYGTAKKFIHRAQHADNPEVTKTDLEMAEWLLSREIEEREHAPAKSLASQTERRPST